MNPVATKRIHSRSPKFDLSPLALAGAALLGVLAAPSSAHAMEYLSWTGTKDLQWTQAENWWNAASNVAAVPAAGDSAMVDNSTGPVLINSTVDVGALYLAQNLNTKAGLTITGAAGKLTSTSAIRVGSAGAGTMRVEKGASVTAGLLGLATGGTSFDLSGVTNQVTLTDTGSSISAGVIAVGGIAKSNMQIQAGAQATASQYLLVSGYDASDNSGTDPVTINAPSSLVVEGAGTKLDTKDLLLGLLGVGSMVVRDGAQVAIAPYEGPGTGDPSQDMPAGVAGSGFLISGPAFKQDNGSYNNAGGNMLISGADTKVSAASNLRMGWLRAQDLTDNPSLLDAPVSAVLTVDNDAQLSVTGPIEIGRETRDSTIKDTVQINIGTGGAPGKINAFWITGSGPASNMPEVNFNHTGNLSFATPMGLNLQVNHLGTGTTTLAPLPQHQPFHAYNGPTTIAKGTLRAGGPKLFSLTSPHILESGATLDANGFDQGVPQLSNAGTLILPNTAALSKSARAKVAPGQPGTKLTVEDISPQDGSVRPGQGLYTSNGGTMVLATALGADASPTDQLIVDGNVVTGSGPTLIDVKNVGGAGAATTGDGIQIVSVTGDSPATAFALKSSPSAGSFIYSLKQVGKNWYLQSAAGQAQSITFTKQADHAFVAGGTFAVSPAATASSALPINYTSTTPAVCTVSGNTVTMVSAGDCTLTAEQPGDAKFLPAAPVSQTFKLSSAGTGGGTGGGSGANIAPVPALDGLGLLLASAGLGGLGAFFMRRRQRAAAQ